MSTGEKALSYTLKVADNGTLGGNNLFTVRGDTFEDFKTNLGAAFGDDFAAVFNVNLKEAGEQVATGAIKGALAATVVQPGGPDPVPAGVATTPAPTAPAGEPATDKQKALITKHRPGQYTVDALTKQSAKEIIDGIANNGWK